MSTQRLQDVFFLLIFFFLTLKKNINVPNGVEMFHLVTFSQDGVHYVKTSEIQLRVDCVGNDIFALHI